VKGLYCHFAEIKDKSYGINPMYIFRASLKSYRSHSPPPASANSSQDSLNRGAEMVGETVNRKRGPCPALLVMLLIFLHTGHCGATTSITKNNASSRYDGRMDELEFMFDSEITRMLANKNTVTDGTNNRNKQAVGCSRGRPYESCLPEGNKPRRPESCNSRYKRNC
jgi:hypothetical protein